MKAISLFAVICLLFPCFTMAHANPQDPTDGNNNARVVPDAPDPDNPIIWEDGATTWTEIFSIEAVKVTGLLVSRDGDYGEKSFRLSDLPSDATQIMCEVNLNHSLEGSDLVATVNGYTQFGVCIREYYIQGGWQYPAVYLNYLDENELGKTNRYTFSIDSYLDEGETYYAFIKNFHGYGNENPIDYIYGTMALYYS